MNAPIAKQEHGPSKSSRLGKGLSAIFADEDPSAPDASGQPRALAVTQIHPNRQQPRRHFDKTALDELAASIKEKGILQPLLVRPHPSKPNAYEIVAGERRWRAAQQAQLHEVPVIVRDIKDKEAVEFALIENIQRADLTPIEEAETYQRLIKEFNHTHEELGEAMGKSRTHIANMLRLNQLPDTVKELMKQGTLTAGHARALLASSNPLQLANEVIMGGLSVRQTENLVKLGQRDNGNGGAIGRNAVTPPRAPRKGSASARAKTAAGYSNADVLKLERDISTWLGLKVKLNQKGSGGGSLLINYGTLDQLEDVLKRLSQTPSEN
jgi:ParB family chromosome partitioning protein